MLEKRKTHDKDPEGTSNGRSIPGVGSENSPIVSITLFCLTEGLIKQIKNNLNHFQL